MQCYNDFDEVLLKSSKIICKGVKLMFLDQQDKAKIIAAIVEAETANVNEFYNEEKLSFRNAYHFLKWDYIFTNLERRLGDSNNLKVIKTKRGYFTMGLLVDSEQKYVYSIVKLKNLNHIKREKNYAHYLWQLASINGVSKTSTEQISMFDDEPQLKDSDILNLLDFEPVKYITILIDESNWIMPTISLALVDKMLNVYYEEILEDVEKVDFSECINNMEVPEAMKQNKIDLKFTPKTDERLNKKRKEKLRKDEEEKHGG